MAETIDHKLSQAESELLTAATANATAAAGALRGAIGTGGAGALGAAAGGRFGARFAKPQSAVVTVEMPNDPPELMERTRNAIAESGAVIADPNAAGDGSVWGFVGSGAMNMTPALVRVDVESSARGSAVRVLATGREGLVKQKIGAKAADRIAAAISS